MNDKAPLIATILALALAAGAPGCASGSAAVRPAAPFEGPATRAVPLPDAAGEGAPKEARVVVDMPALKLATIVLRGGTVLPDHAAPVPVTITALRGAGVVTAGAERLALDAGHVVVLAPGVVHAVIPDPGTDMVLLVHHLGAGPDGHEHDHDHGGRHHEGERPE